MRNECQGCSQFFEDEFLVIQGNLILCHNCYEEMKPFFDTLSSCFTKKEIQDNYDFSSNTIYEKISRKIKDY